MFTDAAAGFILLNGMLPSSSIAPDVCSWHRCQPRDRGFVPALGRPSGDTVSRSVRMPVPRAKPAAALRVHEPATV
jgi:hypothetical protein